MIAKHVPMRAAQKSDFAGLVDYITDSQSKEHRLGIVNITNCDTSNLKAATAEILATQHCNTRSENDKTYHLLISFRAGEQPSEETLKAIEERICAGIGFSEHQRISAIHNDTDNLHIHIAINKIHPTRNTIHEPYRAYKALAELCVTLETDFGLQRDNHTSSRSLSEGQAGDMECHAGVESLVTWIKNECLSDIRAAKTWEELHQIMGDFGLELRAQGAGLIIESEGIRVKPSTIARDISKNALEARLGVFVGGANSKNRKPKKRYKKKPIKQRVNTTELYAKYKDAQKTLTAERSAALANLRRKKNRAIAAGKRASKLRRATIKISDSKGINKRHLYAQANAALRASITAANNDFKSAKDRLYQTHKQRTWADWLKYQAGGGDKVALEALRAREAAQGLKGNTIAAVGKSKKKIIPFPVDNITKKGTIIYRSGRNAIRDDGNKLQVSKGANFDGLEAALNLAMERYGEKITVNGTPEFKAQIIHISIKSQLPITFADPGLESLRQQHIKELNNGRPNRRRPNSSGFSIDGSRAIADKNNSRSTSSDARRRRAGLQPGLRKPNVKSIGRNPPPRSQNRLRGLSELGVVQLSSRSEVLLQGNVSGHLEQHRTERTNGMRRGIAGSGTGVSREQLAAVEKYIKEREQKRQNGFDISNHSLYNNDSLAVTFSGVRTIDEHSMALLKKQDGSIGVLPIDNATAQRLKRVKIGEPVSVTDKGSVKKLKGRNR